MFSEEEKQRTEMEPHTLYILLVGKKKEKHINEKSSFGVCAAYRRLRLIFLAISLLHIYFLAQDLLGHLVKLLWQFNSFNCFLPPQTNVKCNIHFNLAKFGGESLP